MSASDAMLGAFCLALAAAAPHGFAGSGASGPPAAPMACRLSPPGARVVLAELYSSEGCDSCPPAERRFGAFQPAADVVPVVWHVDYFDSQGWADRFALPASQRQKTLVTSGGVPAVVTPQVFVDGLSLPAWRDERAFRSRLLRQAGQTPLVALVLQGLVRDGDQLRFELRAQAQSGALAAVQLQAVLLQGGLVSAVSQGENRGLTLHHEHVVRASAGPVSSNGPWRVQLPLPQPMPAAVTVVTWAQDETGRTLNASWARCTL